MGDVGKAEDASQIQYNIVRVDGQKSAYIPIMKQGGDTNTIAGGERRPEADQHLVDIPKQLVTNRALRSIGVCEGSASRPCCTKALIGLVLTSIMILMFLGSLRATGGRAALDSLSRRWPLSWFCP